MTDEAKWPSSDPEVMALLEAADERSLHAFMADVAEHALAAVREVYRPAGYKFLPDTEAIEVKRAWLAGEASDDDLASAQRGAVWSCYWGNPIAIGAAVLGAAWQLGSGLALAIDEEYAESMTWYESAAEAAADVMREAVKGVGECHDRAAWHRDRDTAGPACREAEARESAWQRDHARARLQGPRAG